MRQIRPVRTRQSESSPYAAHPGSSAVLRRVPLRELDQPVVLGQGPGRAAEDRGDSGTTSDPPGPAARRFAVLRGTLAPPQLTGTGALKSSIAISMRSTYAGCAVACCAA